MSDPAAALLTVPPPRIAPERLADLLHSHWKLSGSLTPLTSERDLNFRLDTGQARLVVKLSNPAEPAEMTDFQTRAFLYVAARDPGLPVQRLLPLCDGAPGLALPEGFLRVFTWLDGKPLHAAPHSNPQRRAIGEALARLTRALEGYDHPAADHYLLWDIARLPSLAPFAKHIAEPDLRAEAEAFIADYSARVVPQLASLPRQVVHADFNPHNLLVAEDDPDLVAGILDFGDMVRTPRACDLGVAASYQVDAADPLGSLSAFLSGYASRIRLTPGEIALIPDLVTARMVATLVITSWRAALYPGNAAYILRNAPSARAGLAAFRAAGPAALSAAVRAATLAEG